MPKDDDLQSFFQLIAFTHLSSRLAKKRIESTSPESEVSDTSCTEDPDSASSQSPPPRSDSSLANQEMSTEGMFSWILTVCNEDVTMQTATLMIEKFFQIMGDTFKATFSRHVRLVFPRS